jgi:filamentous hemagglutinin
MDDLGRQLIFDPNKAVQTVVNEFGTKFNQTISITGANGKTIDVLVSWIKNEDNVIRFVTAIPTKK